MTTIDAAPLTSAGIKPLLQGELGNPPTATGLSAPPQQVPLFNDQPRIADLRESIEDTSSEGTDVSESEYDETQQIQQSNKLSLVQESEEARLQLQPPPRTAFSQIWEGRVLDVSRNSMHVLLTAKIGNVPDHVADIALQWVHDQDIPLVRPGAIFYWVLYKETTRGTIKNSEDFRFRRLPNWTKGQVDEVKADAKRLLSRVKKRPDFGPVG